MKKPKQEKYPREDVEWLMAVAQDRDRSTIPPKFWWIRELTPDQAKTILLQRFQTLAAGLVNLCVTGNYNPRSKQRNLLKMFSGPKVDLNVTAQMLRAGLKESTAEELNHTAQIAIIQAIETSRENLASTIVVRFRDLIEELIEEKKAQYVEDIPHEWEDPSSSEEDVYIDTLLIQLREQSPEDWVVAKRIIAGEKVKAREISTNLKRFMSRMLPELNLYK